MAVSVEQYASQVVDSGLMSADDIKAALSSMRREARPKDGAELARVLVREKKLTAYQAQEIYSRRGRDLVLGTYVVLDKLGQGGMGMVLKAQHMRMKRIVALKVLSPAVTKTPEAVKRFQREVEAAARLMHPNIVTAFDGGQSGNTHFLVIEYVDGSDLSSLVKKTGTLPLDKALHCVLQAARGLEYAHNHGVVHRDIKPGNLLLDREGTVKILDMGLARLDSAGAQQDELTGTGQIMGTVDYMAPEQAKSTKSADARADIYSLGVTLWYLLVGRPMYQGETVIEKLMAHQSDPIPSLLDHCDSATPLLDMVFQKMVAKSPEARYQTMREVIAELENCRGNSSGTAPSLSVAAGDDSRLDDFLRGIGPTSGAAEPSAATRPVAVGSVTHETEGTLALRSPQVETDPKTEHSLPGPTDVAARMAKSKHHGQPKKPPVPLIAGGAGALLLVVLGVWFALRGEGDQEVAEAPASTVAPARVVSPPPTSNVPPSATTMPNTAPPSGTDAPSLASESPVAFGGHRYQLVQRKLNWDDAHAEAEALGGHLLTINSQEERDWISDQLSRVRSDQDVSERRVFLGVKRLKGQSDWRWVTGEPFDESVSPEGRAPGGRGSFNHILDCGPTNWRVSTPAVHRWFIVEWDMLDDTQPHQGGDVPTTAQPTEPAAADDAPPIPAEALTFAGHRYLLVDSMGNWNQANARAEAMGGHLVTINTQQELDWLRDHIARERLDGSRKYDRILLGAKRLDGETQWSWITGEPFDEALFPGLRGPGGNRVISWIAEDDSTTWRTLSNNQVAAAFIVEWDTLGSTPMGGTGAMLAENFALDPAVNPDGVERPGVNLPRVLEPHLPMTIEMTVFPRSGENPRENNSLLTVDGKIELKKRGDLWILVRSYSQPGMKFSAAMAKVVLGQPARLAAVSTGTELRLFVNGKLIEKCDCADLPADTPSKFMRLASSPGENGYFPFDGTIDEVRISSIARYDADYEPVERLEADADTLTLYHCDEGTGNVLKDSSGNGHDGTIEGVGWVRVAGGTSDTSKFEIPPREAQQLAGHENIIRAVVCPDNRHAISAGWDNTWRVWDLQTGAEVVHVPAHSNNLNCLAVSPDGTLLATGASSHDVKLWSLPGGNLQRSYAVPESAAIIALQFSPDSRRLLVGCDTGLIRLHDVNADAPVRDFVGHTARVHNFAYLPGGGQFISVSQDKTIRVWDIAAGKQTASLPDSPSPVSSAAVSPDGKLLAIGRQSSIDLWNLPELTPAGSLLPRNTSNDSLVFLPGGDYLASGSQDKKLRIWHLGLREVVHTFTAENHATNHIAMTPDGKYLVSGGGYTVIAKLEADGDYRVHVWPVPEAFLPSP